ncbi:MAG: DUF5592 family protein [Lachnospiraceae bacterium]
MRYLVTKEIKSESQVWKSFSVLDVIFLVVWFVVGFIALRGNVNGHIPMQILYCIFIILTGVIMVVPSSKNPKRRFYRSMIIYLIRPVNELYVYRMNEEGDKTHEQSHKRKRYTKRNRNRQIRRRNRLF